MTAESDFNIHRIIAASDPLLNVRSTTVVDSTTLSNVLRVMGRKIEQQDDEILRLKAEVNDIRMEHAAMRATRVEHEALKEEVAQVSRQAITSRSIGGEGTVRVPDSVMMHITPSGTAVNQTTTTTTTVNQNKNMTQIPAAYGQQPNMVNQSTISQRGISQTMVNQPASNQPMMNQRGISQPVGQPMMSQSGMGHPMMNQSGMGQPMMNQSGTQSLNQSMHQAINPNYGIPTGNLPKTGIMLEADGGALRVLGVKPGSAAMVAGIQQGDLIHGVEGRVACLPKDFVDALAKKKVGDNFLLEVTTPGQPRRNASLILRGE